jgi:hypothetical protein
MYVRALVTSAGLDAVAGAWLFVSAFLLHPGEEYLFVNNLTCGALAVILAFGAFAHVWLAWLPAAIGAWVMISPLALGFTDDTFATLNNAVTGIVILILAVESYAVTSSARDRGVMSD